MRRGGKVSKHLSKKEMAGAGKNYEVSISLPAYSAKVYKVIG